MTSTTAAPAPTFPAHPWQPADPWLPAWLDPLARERTTGHRAMLTRHRALRSIGALTVPQSRDDDPRGALAIAADTGKRAAHRAMLADTARRDAMAAADRYPLTAEQLVARCADAIDHAARTATPDERDDALSYALYRIGQRHGWTPASADVAPRWVEQMVAGRITDQRIRAARNVQLPDDDGHDDDEQRERDHVTRGNVWAAFSTEPLTAASSAPAAVAVSADALADALQAVALAPVPTAARFAIGAALNGYGSGPELAAALGISEGAARKRLHDGRAQLRGIAPTARMLADAIADAAAMLDSDRVRLSAAARAADQLVTDARRGARLVDTARGGDRVDDRGQLRPGSGSGERQSRCRTIGTTGQHGSGLPTREPLPTRSLPRMRVVRGTAPMVLRQWAAGYPVPVLVALVYRGERIGATTPGSAPRDGHRDYALTYPVG